MFYKLTSARGAGQMRERAYIIIGAMIPAAIVLFIDLIRQGWVVDERPELLVPTNEGPSVFLSDIMQPVTCSYLKQH